jgi:TBC1 domain family protein 5
VDNSRLLFSREFPAPDALTLWDGLFAIDPTLQFVDWICVTMLLRIRDARSYRISVLLVTLILTLVPFRSVLDADYSNFVQLLLRYPAPPDYEHRIRLLLKQALHLRENVTETGGDYVRQQNALLGAQAGTKSGTRAEEGPSRYVHRRTGSSTPSGTGKPVGRHPTIANEMGGPSVGELAKALFERGEGLGLSKAVMGTLGELRVRLWISPFCCCVSLKFTAPEKRRLLSAWILATATGDALARLRDSIETSVGCWARTRHRIGIGETPSE